MGSFLNRFNSIHNFNQNFNKTCAEPQNGFYHGYQSVKVGVLARVTDGANLHQKADSFMNSSVLRQSKGLLEF